MTDGPVVGRRVDRPAAALAELHLAPGRLASYATRRGIDVRNSAVSPRASDASARTSGVMEGASFATASGVRR